MKLPQTVIGIRIVVLGAGGTGAYLIPHLYRIAFASRYHVRVIVCDGDTVEEANLVRQNFTFQDIGENKALVLARRYAGVFGIEAEYIPEFIETEQALSSLVKTRAGTEQAILIGAVDNNRSRQMCHAVFQAARDLIYIDAGNGEATGQVVCGVRRGGKTLWKPAAGVYPDILDDTDRFPSELSCAQAAVSAPQTVAANLMAATLVTGYVYRLLIAGEVKTRYVTFSANLLSVRPVMNKRPVKKIGKPDALPAAA